MEKKYKILIVDDEPFYLTEISRALGINSHYQIFTASDTIHAFKIAEENKPEIILSDYYMPYEDGFSFCKKIKSHAFLFDTMFVILSVASEVETKVKGLEVGADDFITKPFDPDELHSKVKALLRIKSLQETLKTDKQKLEKLNQELDEGLLALINLLNQLIGLRVPNATLRASKALEMVRWVNDRLSLDDDVKKTIEIAIQLREIGKITLPDDIVRKNCHELSEEERLKVMQFPVLGQLLIDKITRLAEVSVAIRHQLENYDGTGYPDKLQSQHIPIASKILRAVNLVEQESSKPKCNFDNLIEVVKKSRGTVLDPRITQLLEEYLFLTNDPLWLNDKQQISVYELKDGMVLANDLYTGSGIKLLQKGFLITTSTIEKILIHHHNDPIINNIYISKT